MPTPVPNRHKGELALVTGAGRPTGIGAACVSRLADEGAKVALVDILPEVNETRKSLGYDESQVKSYVCDTADETSYKKLLEDIRKDFGQPITLLVANSAYFQILPAHELSMEDFDKQMHINLRSYFMNFKFLIDEIKSVVMIASVHSCFGLPGRPAYAAAKAGIVNMGRQLAVEYGPKIRVNSVSPGAIDTGYWKTATKESYDKTVDAAVAKRLGKPSEIAAGVSFLLSDDASYVTGTNLFVDGGWSATKISD